MLLASMKAIPLTQGRCALVSDVDYDVLSCHKWYFLRERSGSVGGYAARNISKNGKRTLELMHRRILNCSIEHEVDHRDGDGLNNQRSNLRTCTRSENQCNRAVFKNNRLGRKGISFSVKRQRFLAVIYQHGKQLWHRSYKTLEEAVAGRAEMVARLHQQYGRS